MVNHVTQQTFQQEVIQSQVPVLVDFYGEWCGPCKILAPWLDQLASQMQGRLKVVKVEDKEAALIQHYGIRAFPTLVLFKNGQPVFNNVGVPRSPDLLRQMVEENLGR